MQKLDTENYYKKTICYNINIYIKESNKYLISKKARNKLYKNI